MTIEQTSDLVDKIKIHRPMFVSHLDKTSLTKFKVEWHKILEPYVFQDVSEKLDEYFRDTNNFGRYPDAYYLTKYLSTEEQKERAGTILVRCQECQKIVDLNDYERHYSRCSSVRYIARMREKYFNKTTDIEKLQELDQEKFDEVYEAFIRQSQAVCTDEQEKRCIDNLVRMYDGESPLYEPKINYGRIS